MKVEGGLFIGCAVFFAGSDVVYWYFSRETTGTVALAFAVGLAFLAGFYCLITGRRLPPRPEDDLHAVRGVRHDRLRLRVLPRRVRPLGPQASTSQASTSPAR
jgi:hypothetical protein